MRVHAFVTASILINDLHELTMKDENVSENHKTVEGKKVKLTETWNQCNIVIGCSICFARSEVGGFRGRRHDLQRSLYNTMLQGMRQV